MKKILKATIIVGIISIFIPAIVSAKEAEKTITNNMGVVMTQEEYDYIKNTLGEPFANNMDEEFITGALNNEITKLEPDNKPTPYTAYEPITGLRYDISVFASGNTGKYAFLLLGSWTTLPSMKSFDVLGFRWTNNNFIIDSWNTYQDTNLVSGKVNYSLTGTNTKYITSSGVGTSMNLIDAAQNYIRCDMAITGHFTSAVSTTVVGSYQHAWSDVPLDQSLNYTFSSAGLGGVFNYPANIRAKYSNFEGYTYTFTPKLMS